MIFMMPEKSTFKPLVMFNQLMFRPATPLLSSSQGQVSKACAQQLFMSRNRFNATMRPLCLALRQQIS
jgi:hypothetical protein